MLLATAGAKLGLYVAAYGWTLQRVNAAAGLLWLAGVFCLCLWRLRRPFPLTALCVWYGAVLYCCLLYTSASVLTTMSHRDQTVPPVASSTPNTEITFPAILFSPFPFASAAIFPICAGKNLAGQKKAPAIDACGRGRRGFFMMTGDGVQRISALPPI